MQAVIQVLAEGGVRFLAMRCAGFDKVRTAEAGHVSTCLASLLGDQCTAQQGAACLTQAAHMPQRSVCRWMWQLRPSMA